MTQNTIPAAPASGRAATAAGSATLLVDGSSSGVERATGSGSGSVPDRPARRSTQPAHALSFGGVLRAERIKMLSLRSIKITLILTLAAGIGLAGLIGIAGLDMMQQQGGADAPAAGMQVYLLMVSTFTAPFLAMVFGVLGVFAIASEYSSGMILSTLAAAPKRGMVFASKAVVLAMISAIGALIIVGAGLLIAVAFLPASAAQLGSWEVLSGVLGTVLYLILIALLAFGVATLLRSTAGGISTIVGLTFVLPVGFQVLMMTGWQWVEVVAHYLPNQLGSVLSSGAAGQTEPAYGVAAIAMIIWAAAALIPAVISFRRRDAK